MARNQANTMTPWRRAHPPGEKAPSTAKRRHERFLTDLRLSLTLGETERSTFQSRSLDLCEGGVGGIFDEHWDLGTRVNLEIFLPVANAPLKVGGVVRHHTGARYGFEFVDLIPEHRKIIQDACKFLGKRKSAQR